MAYPTNRPPDLRRFNPLPSPPMPTSQEPPVLSDPALVMDDSDESSSLLHFLLGGSLLKPASLPERPARDATAHAGV